MSEFIDTHNRLAPMQGYQAIPWYELPKLKFDAMRIAALDARAKRWLGMSRRERAFFRAFQTVRRETWDARESRLRATWESYG